MGRDDIRKPAVANSLSDRVYFDRTSPVAAGAQPVPASETASATDWVQLERTLRQSPPSALYAVTPATLEVIRAPENQRRSLPLLSYAAAIVHCQQGAQFDLTEGIKAMVYDGLTLHAKWAGHADTDSAVVAGAMWLLGRASILGAGGDPRLDELRENIAAVEQLIADRTRHGLPPGSRALCFFHAVAALLSLLRSDWVATRRHAELCMLASQDCDLFGIAGAAAMSMCSLISGNSDDEREVALYLAEHEAHDCPPLTWMQPFLNLPQAFAAIRSLDRATAENKLALIAAGSDVTRWFSLWPLQAWLRACADLLWSTPERALATFDAAVSAHGDLGEQQGNWYALLLRTRIELLLAVGAVNQAQRSLAQLRQTAERTFTLVPAARFELSTGDLDGALTTAEEGAHSLRVIMPDRAALQAIRAAALVLGGADQSEIRTAVDTACHGCKDVNNLLPIAMLPHTAIIGMLKAHGPHSDGTPCPLRDADDRGAFDPLEHRRAAVQTLVQLTRREHELLPLLATSATVRQIAAHLHLSVNTVRKQVLTLSRKLGVNSRRDLVAAAQRMGLI